MLKEIKEMSTIEKDKKNIAYVRTASTKRKTKKKKVFYIIKLCIYWNYWKLMARSKNSQTDIFFISNNFSIVFHLVAQ